MGADSQRAWPAWDPACTACHDPHGDGANLAMIQREIYDKGSLVGGVVVSGPVDAQWAVPLEAANDNARKPVARRAAAVTTRRRRSFERDRMPTG